MIWLLWDSEGGCPRAVHKASSDLNWKLSPCISVGRHWRSCGWTAANPGKHVRQFGSRLVDAIKQTTLLSNLMETKQNSTKPPSTLPTVALHFIHPGRCENIWRGNYCFGKRSLADEPSGITAVSCEAKNNFTLTNRSLSVDFFSL